MPQTQCVCVCAHACAPDTVCLYAPDTVCLCAPDTVCLCASDTVCLCVQVNVVEGPIQIESYASLPSMVYNQSNLGFFRDRNGLCF